MPECGNCKHAFRHSRSELLCRRHPPVVFQRELKPSVMKSNLLNGTYREDAEYTYDTRFPCVSRGDLCGEHEPGEDLFAEPPYCEVHSLSGERRIRFAGDLSGDVVVEDWYGMQSARVPAQQVHESSDIDNGILRIKADYARDRLGYDSFAWGRRDSCPEGE